ncbi:hypothetical protein M0812_04521 [Anaeramoeba flamelloides]|uniref:INTS8 TPR repeats domain-containing protein n=1 Tax=Anaeramoeba flamelloides TaxID=1746091 RepID=A0AAV8AEK9_9EUKA|nr:hypothetical protein M0812_04521 [Anaeramoeba flamelloides]
MTNNITFFELLEEKKFMDHLNLLKQAREGKYMDPVQPQWPKLITSFIEQSTVSTKEETSELLIRSATRTILYLNITFEEIILNISNNQFYLIQNLFRHCSENPKHSNYLTKLRCDIILNSLFLTQKTKGKNTEIFLCDPDLESHIFIQQILTELLEQTVSNENKKKKRRTNKKEGDKKKKLENIEIFSTLCYYYFLNENLNEAKNNALECLDILNNLKIKTTEQDQLIEKLKSLLSACEFHLNEKSLRKNLHFVIQIERILLQSEKQNQNQTKTKTKGLNKKKNQNPNQNRQFQSKQKILAILENELLKVKEPQLTLEYLYSLLIRSKNSNSDQLLFGIEKSIKIYILIKIEVFSEQMNQFFDLDLLHEITDWDDKSQEEIFQACKKILNKTFPKEIILNCKTLVKKLLFLIEKKNLWRLVLKEKICTDEELNEISLFYKEQSLQSVQALYSQKQHLKRQLTSKNIKPQFIKLSNMKNFKDLRDFPNAYTIRTNDESIKLSNYSVLKNKYKSLIGLNRFHQAKEILGTLRKFNPKESSLVYESLLLEIEELNYLSKTNSNENSGNNIISEGKYKGKGNTEKKNQNKNKKKNNKKIDSYQLCTRILRSTQKFNYKPFHFYQKLMNHLINTSQYPLVCRIYKEMSRQSLPSNLYRLFTIFNLIAEIQMDYSQSLRSTNSQQQQPQKQQQQQQLISKIVIFWIQFLGKKNKSKILEGSDKKSNLKEDCINILKEIENPEICWLLVSLTASALEIIGQKNLLEKDNSHVFTNMRYGNFAKMIINHYKMKKEFTLDESLIFTDHESNHTVFLKILKYFLKSLKKSSDYSQSYNWLICLADVYFIEKKYRSVLKNYLKAALIISNMLQQTNKLFTSLLFETSVFDLIIAALEYLGLKTLVCVLLQFKDNNIDYKQIFTYLKSINPEAIDQSIFYLFWDMNILEFLASYLHREGFTNKSNKIIKYIKKKSYNENNPLPVRKKFILKKKIQVFEYLFQRFLEK